MISLQIICTPQKQIATVIEENLNFWAEKKLSTKEKYS